MSEKIQTLSETNKIDRNDLLILKGRKRFKAALGESLKLNGNFFNTQTLATI